MRRLALILLFYIALLGCGKNESNQACPEQKCSGKNLIRLSSSATGYSFKLEDCDNIAMPCKEFCPDHQNNKIDTLINDYRD